MCDEHRLVCLKESSSSSSEFLLFTLLEQGLKFHDDLVDRVGEENDLILRSKKKSEDDGELLEGSLGPITAVSEGDELTSAKELKLERIKLICEEVINDDRKV